MDMLNLIAQTLEWGFHLDCWQISICVNFKLETFAHHEPFLAN
jgi:hypothetical protein